MSGSNPFRRSKIIPTAESLPSIPNDSNDAVTPSTAHPTSIFDVPSTAQSSTQPKIVRIATSPLPSPLSDSTSHFPAVSSTGIGVTRRGSLPPPGNYEDENKGTLDSQATISSFVPPPSDGVVIDKGSNQPPRRSNAEPLESRLPADALAAVASRSPTSGRASYNRFMTSDTTPSTGKANNNNNPLDVDAFTRLLMTGSAEAAMKSSATNPPAALSSESDSDSAPQIASDAYVGNIEPKRLQPVADDADVGAKKAPTLPAKIEPSEIQRTSSARRPKPPPPRSHHGKPISNGDSAPSSRKASDNGTAPQIQMLADLPTDHREMLSSLSGGTGRSSPTSSETSSIEGISSLHRTSSLSKRPPTPPLARRRSQMKPNTRQPASERPNRLSLTPKSLNSQGPGPTSPGISTKTPPRPPSRRYEKMANGALEDSTSSQPRTLQSKDKPTPPPSNHSTDDQNSMASSSSPPPRQPPYNQNQAGPATITGSIPLMPPPPPPPRRLRASSKSSSNSAQAPIVAPFVAAAAAAAAADTTADANANDAEANSAPSVSNAEDILADLSRLQREVDDLRIHYSGRKVSQ